MAVKGKNTFISYEADEIKNILLKIRNSDISLQKDYRNQLRSKYQFFISDFTNSKKGFTPSDFDSLVQLGQIIVTKPPAIKVG
jgi:hypothetical protein